MIKEFEIEALIKVKYIFRGEGEYDAPTVEALESSELEVMLDKDLADCIYTDNQSVRFDNVEVVKIKAKEIKKG